MTLRSGQDDQRRADSTPTECDLIEAFTSRAPTELERKRCDDEESAGDGLVVTGGVLMGVAGLVLGLGFGVTSNRRTAPS